VQNIEPARHEQSAQLSEPYPSHRGSDILIAICLLVILTLAGYGFVYAFPQFQQASVIIAWLLLALGVGVIGYLLFHKHRVDSINLQAKRDEVRRANELHELQMQEALLAPDMSGNYAVIWQRQSGQIIRPDPGQIIQPVPHTQHIEYNYSDTSTRAGQEQLAAAHNYEQPQLATIIEELTPNTLEFVFGLDPLTGQLARTNLPKAVHIQLLGASGQGKSRQATSILTQLCARNDTQHLQLALIDCEGETTAPFQQLPHVRYLADESKEAAKAFRGLVNELERRDVSRVLWPVIFIFVEEFLNLRRTMPADYRDQALEDYTTLALRGRKRGMFLFSIGQTAYTEKAIRDAQMQFLSSMAFAVKPTAARSAGFTNTDLLNQLYQERRPGQFLLERPAGDSILLAPYVDPGQVSGLLSGFQVVAEDAQSTALSTAVETTLQPETKPTATPLDARSLRIRDLLKQGVSHRQIVQEIWGVSSGAGYTKAQKELAEIIATLL
jgi:hypothetical protein